MIREVSKGLPLTASNAVLQKVFELENAHDFNVAYAFQRNDFDITNLIKY